MCARGASLNTERMEIKMKENLTKYSSIKVVLTTGTVITAKCATIEEMYIINSISEALQEKGAIVADSKVIRYCDVTGLYARRIRGCKA
jgi:precorrin isomerase